MVLVAINCYLMAIGSWRLDRAYTTIGHQSFKNMRHAPPAAHSFENCTVPQITQLGLEATKKSKNDLRINRVPVPANNVCLETLSQHSVCLSTETLIQHTKTHTYDTKYVFEYIFRGLVVPPSFLSPGARTRLNNKWTISMIYTCVKLCCILGRRSAAKPLR